MSEVATTTGKVASNDFSNETKSKHHTLNSDIEGALIEAAQEKDLEAFKELFFFYAQRFTITLPSF